MTIQYLEDEILQKEKNMNGKPLIGYINPNGTLLDYSMLIGPYGHENWRNPATHIFLNYISYIVRDFNVDEIKNEEIYSYNKYEGIDDVVKRGLDYFQEINHTSYKDFLCSLKEEIQNQSSISFKDKSEFDLLKYDLLKLFDKLYSNNDFFNSLGRFIYAESSTTMCDKYKRKANGGLCYYNHYNYLVVQLMSYFKDICVQYLGYDSIERAWPIGDKNIINNVFNKSYGYTFSNNPRIITTSANNINERFYNWILMDWTIQKIPKKIWDIENKIFKDEDYIFDYIHKEKEEIFGKEIASIKRLIKKEDRYKYFR